ncbi:hypothetical protein JAK51_11785 [Stenotrophomonas maltophilia]|uniref:hypothetical protein n=1 Tax=Stenotrophomonas maltophilia TaxID=40324 RepID=UPI0021C9DAD7|nr:hypothetical protein [Stenotrophomonas maltophilia]MCU1126895.1 hypothetical protein [Stenotrophomonas maltophilia]
MRIRTRTLSALRRLAFGANYFCMVLIVTLAQPAAAQPAAPGSQAIGYPAIPATHHAVSRKTVTQDGVLASLARYERRDRRNVGMGGEHFSVLTSRDGKLLGFMNISLDLAQKPLPSREMSERAAKGYLQSVAPDLLKNMRVTSIAPYEKPLRLADSGNVIQLSGMRVKARNLTDGSWFWVVVTGNGEPMAFERDVGWSTLLFRRSSEYWLDDTWLAERG